MASAQTTKPAPQSAQSRKLFKAVQDGKFEIVKTIIESDVTLARSRDTDHGVDPDLCAERGFAQAHGLFSPCRKAGCMHAAACLFGEDGEFFAEVDAGSELVDEYVTTNGRQGLTRPTARGTWRRNGGDGI